MVGVPDVVVRVGVRGLVVVMVGVVARAVVVVGVDGLMVDEEVMGVSCLLAWGRITRGLGRGLRRLSARAGG